ncbi:MAG: DUF86 domain-containing protein [Dehalococcoidia bacterium]|nr:DUF86 domain-containing protein [Dehalococcoidia bacterium]
MKLDEHGGDTVRLHHMVEYAQKAIQFTRGESRNDLDSDEMLAFATIYLIEIIGEAARNLSSGLCSQHPEVPWELITGTGNRLAHGYNDVDLDVIWTIVKKDLPLLVRQLKRILKEREN